MNNNFYGGHGPHIKKSPYFLYCHFEFVSSLDLNLANEYRWKVKLGMLRQKAGREYCFVYTSRVCVSGYMYHSQGAWGLNAGVTVNHWLRTYSYLV